VYSSCFERQISEKPVGVGTRRSAMAPDCGVHVERRAVGIEDIGASIMCSIFIAAIIDGPHWKSRW
jgi:hypothetical protein